MGNRCFFDLVMVYERLIGKPRERLVVHSCSKPGCGGNHSMESGVHSEHWKMQMFVQIHLLDDMIRTDHVNPCNTGDPDQLLSFCPGPEMFYVPSLCR